MSCPASLERVRILEQPATGPIHAIAETEDGCICYSDELGHAVACLDAQDRLAWNLAQGEFRYPRGLSLGWIRAGGLRQQCLGVADSWHQRVCFLSLSGQLMASWNTAAQLPFADLSDVLYRADGESSSGIWLILDTGNHRICALSEQGEWLSQVGREFSSTLMDRWIIPGCGFRNHPLPQGYVYSFAPCDFLWYPRRLLGNTSGPLYLWESRQREARQVLMGSAFPMDPGISPVEWLAADDLGALLWNGAEHKLTRLDARGACAGEMIPSGSVVCSNLPSTSFYIQNGMKLERWIWSPGKQTPHSYFGLLAASAQRKLGQLNRAEACRAVSGLVKCHTLLCELAESHETSLRKDFSQDEASKNATETLSLLRRERTQRLVQLHKALHSWCTGCQEARLASGESLPADLATALAEAGSAFQGIFHPLRDQFAAVQERIDALHNMGNPCEISGQVMAESRDSFLRTSREIESELERVQAWIFEWSGETDNRSQILQIQPGGDFENEAMSSYEMSCPAPQPFRSAMHTLRDLERISISGICESGNLQPHGLTMDSHGRLFVSLSGAGRILCLNPNGQPEGFLGSPGQATGELNAPGLVACDASDRIWVCDYGNDRIQSFQFPAEKGNACADPGMLNGKSFSRPSGICRLEDNSLLVSDTGNHRILRRNAEGGWSEWSAKFGTCTGELRHPAGICAIAGGFVYLADSRNHRIQRASGGDPLAHWAGKCGIGRNYLYLPGHVAAFHDGVVVVSHNPWNQCLKIFSPEGTEEESIVPGFTIGGLFAEGNRLWVTEFDRDAIRVFERTRE